VVPADRVAGARDRRTAVTSNFASLTLTGPLARETFARFCALDLRPAVAPVGALRPGSIGRQPGILIREAEDRYLFLFGWATGEYMWSVVADAGEHLGGTAIGVDALGALDA
jgi:sarcosine oxidase gamma subunit